MGAARKVNRYESISDRIPRCWLSTYRTYSCFLDADRSPGYARIVPNVNRLADAVRKAGNRVIWVRCRFRGRPMNGAPFSQPIRARVRWRNYSRDRRFRAACRAGRRPEDTILVETVQCYSGSSDVDQVLRAAGVIHTIVITGTVTNVCCESSARDTMMLNYRVVSWPTPRSFSDAEHNATLVNMVRVFADVRRTDEVIEILSRSRA